MDKWQARIPVTNEDVHFGWHTWYLVVSSYTIPVSKIYTFILVTILNTGRSYVDFFLHSSHYHRNYHDTVKYYQSFGTSISNVVIGCRDYLRKGSRFKLGIILKFSWFFSSSSVDSWLISFLSTRIALCFLLCDMCVWNHNDMHMEEGHSAENVM